MDNECAFCGRGDSASRHIFCLDCQAQHHVCTECAVQHLTQPEF